MCECVLKIAPVKYRIRQFREREKESHTRAHMSTQTRMEKGGVGHASGPQVSVSVCDCESLCGRMFE